MYTGIHTTTSCSFHVLPSGMAVDLCPLTRLLLNFNRKVYFPLSSSGVNLLINSILFNKTIIIFSSNGQTFSGLKPYYGSLITSSPLVNVYKSLFMGNNTNFNVLLFSPQHPVVLNHKVGAYFINKSAYYTYRCHTKITAVIGIGFNYFNKKARSVFHPFFNSFLCGANKVINNLWMGKKQKSGGCSYDLTYQFITIKH